MNELGSVLRNLNGPVLITGHTGFKGTWLTLLLEQLGVSAVGFSLEPEKTSLFTRANRLGKIPEFFGNINSIDTVENVFKMFKPSCVIHMAAEAIVLNAYDKPIQAFTTNVIGTANVLEIATLSPNVKISGCATSDKVYKNDELGRRFVENDKLGGNDPYSASKVAAEQAIAAWRNLAMSRNGSKIIGFRSGNVIGGGDFAKHRIIPDLIRTIYYGDELIIRNRFATRPWQHTIDPLIGYLMALEFNLNSEKEELLDFNFGPDDQSLSVEQLIDIARESLPDKDIAVSYETINRYEASALQLSSENAFKILGWKPIFNQEDAIRKTFTWWKEHLDYGSSAESLCKTEIIRTLEGLYE
jgi:CDP-glucose 4,6-dehydratase